MSLVFAALQALYIYDEHMPVEIASCRAEFNGAPVCVGGVGLRNGSKEVDRHRGIGDAVSYGGQTWMRKREWEERDV